MRWVSTTVLAVLLVGLGTFYYVYEIRQAPEREKAATVKDRLWKELEGKDVDEIVVRKGGAEALHLKKNGDAWSLVAPVSATADRGAADGLATSLATLRVEREIEANPQKPADFGLAPPTAEVSFKAKGQERTVKLGAKSPSGVWAYAQEGAKPAVILVPEGILSDAQKAPSEYRDKTLLAFDRKDVKTVEVRSPTGQVVAAAGLKGADDWQLTAPLASGADRDAIATMLEKLRSAKIKEFVTDAPKSLAEYGLDRPARLSLGVGRRRRGPPGPSGSARRCPTRRRSTRSARARRGYSSSTRSSGRRFPRRRSRSGTRPCSPTIERRSSASSSRAPRAR